MKRGFVFIILIINALYAFTALGDDLTVSDFSGYAGQTNIILQAGGNILFTGGTLNLPPLPEGASQGQLMVQAGSNITVDVSSAIIAGSGWSITMIAGTNFSGVVSAGSDGIYLDNGSSIQAMDGSISLFATNEVQIGWMGSPNGSGPVNMGTGSITTTGGGSIHVVTRFGDVNTGSTSFGFDYFSSSPYYAVDPHLGGISTAAGGDVAINAGGNVTSYCPFGTVGTSDGGSGAFGSQPGNVTVNANNNVYGHYVVANGTGTITAGQNIGNNFNLPFALSLISGGWNINAPHGSVYLAEVRNPNGIFNGTSNPISSQGKHWFNYDPQAYVNVTANGVFLTDQNLPRLNTATIPALYPPILSINAGTITLAGNVTLFPSPSQSLQLNVSGNFTASTSSGPTPYLLMSDSAQTQWLSSSTFGLADHGSFQSEPADSNPVIVNIAESMENVNLITTKPTGITVGGNMMNCSFSGQNLSATDITSITVTGQIYNASSYLFVDLPQSIPPIPPGDLLPGETNSWNAIFTLAVNPGLLSSYQFTPSETASQVLQSIGLFGENIIQGNGGLAGVNPGFVYDPVTEELGFAGPMPSSVLSDLTSTLTVLHLENGLPVTNSVTGQLETDTVSWASSGVEVLYFESQQNPSLTAIGAGYALGGPGQFNVTAGSISLGNSFGIFSCGVSDPFNQFGRYTNLVSVTPSGATVNVTVNGADGPNLANDIVSSLDMPTSAIAAIGGGDVNVTSAIGSIGLNSEGFALSNLGFLPGIYTSGGGNVNVTAAGNIEVENSTIATMNGGNVFVESLQGNVNIRGGGGSMFDVAVSYTNSITGDAAEYSESIYGGGLMAATLVPASPGQGFPSNAATTPGNITVLTPNGNIEAGPDSILQLAPNGAPITDSTITLDAGSSEFLGNAYLVNNAVTGGTININATGNTAWPVFTTSINQSNGGYTITWKANNLSFNSEDSDNFVIQSSSDLVNWQVINPTLTAPVAGGFSHQISAPGNQNTFYRVIWK